MGDLFSDGQTGSRAAFWQALTDIQTTGQGVLDSLTELENSSLLAFNQGLQGLAGRRQRSNRLPSIDRAGLFAVSDLLDIDQASTTATVRADSNAVTLKQRNAAPPAIIVSQVFSSSAGTVQNFGNLYRVYSNRQVATGTFDITFRSAVDLSLAVFDLVLTPSSPVIAVSGSLDGVVYKDALEVVRNGVRVSAYLPAGEIKFLRIVITPSMPDNIGGYTYTFGLTGFYPYLVGYYLDSQLASKTLTLTPQSAQVRVQFEEADGIKAFLSFDGIAFSQVTDGLLVSVPGAVTVSGSSVVTTTGGALATVPATTYVHSLQVRNASGALVPLAPGLDPATATHLTGPVCCWHGLQLTMRPATVGTTYTLSYSYGPASLPVWLRVELVSRDAASTPIFSGLTLQNAY